MKCKRILKLMGIFVAVAAFSVGCGSKTTPSGEASAKEETDQNDKNLSKTEDVETKGEADMEQNEEDEGEPNTAADDIESDLEEDQQTKTVKIYLINDETGQLESKEMEAKDEQEIWKCLQDTGIINDDCKLLGFTVDEKAHTMELDFNSATGDRFRSMGTTGTEEILACIVDTYLDAYSCEKIKLTEEGNVPDTGDGANLDGYMGRIEL